MTTTAYGRLKTRRPSPHREASKELKALRPGIPRVPLQPSRGKRGILWFAVVGRSVRIRCDDAGIRDLLASYYGGMLQPGSRLGADLEYRVASVDGESRVYRGAREIGRARSPGAVLFLLKQDLVVEIQRSRPELYFLHAAVLEREGRALILVAESGGGKSTTTWALLHHGFHYGSDELAPVEPATRRVQGFPSALCLKSDPPDSFPLPTGAIRTPEAVHVPVAALPAPLAQLPSPLAAIFFVRYRPGTEHPVVTEIGAAEAGARLFAQALNALAHPHEGLDAAIDLARGSRCFSLATGDLRATSRLVVEACC